MRGCLLLAVAVTGSLALGLAVMAAVRAVWGDEQLGAALGTAAWLSVMILLVAYGSLWVARHEQPAPAEDSLSVPRFRIRRQDKMQAAELRMGFLLAMIGGTTTAMIGCADAVVALVTVLGAVLGALIGVDLKRRYKRLRKSSPPVADVDG